MNNTAVEKILTDCADELAKIEAIQVGDPKKFIDVVEYLNKYALIKACGTIEFAFKKIILDVLAPRSPQIETWLESTFRKQGLGPRIDIIIRNLGKFDGEWQHTFKKAFKHMPDKARIENSLNSLVNNRNMFAHGGTVTITLQNVQEYFNHASEALKLLDRIVI